MHLSFLVPSNLFAVTSLRHLADMAHAILHDGTLAEDAAALADEVEHALNAMPVRRHPKAHYGRMKWTAS